MSFELTILGSNAAIPTLNRFPSSQYLSLHDRHMLIDCGEGSQMQMQRFNLKKSKLEFIFISHVHGDHILGLPGLIFSMNLQNRLDPLHIFAPPSLFEILDLFIKHSETRMRFEIIRHPTQDKHRELIYEDTLMRVYSFPLYHRLPTTGFFFEENEKLRKLNVTACEQHNIPFTFYNDIKRGKDYITPGGKMIPNEQLSFSRGKSLSYAYCSDTMFNEEVAREVSGADLLYHEATFLHEKLERAGETMHSTARQAGMVAKMAHAKKLLIGHFSSRYDNLDILLEEARTEFPATELAIEGKKLLVE